MGRDLSARRLRKGALLSIAVIALVACAVVFARPFAANAAAGVNFDGVFTAGYAFGDAFCATYDSNNAPVELTELLSNAE